jgi:hypothetical protein
MAMKDWRKLAEKKDVITWQSKKRIGSGLNPLLVRLFKREEDWIVAIGLLGGYAEEEDFKTKSQALAYARSYMRTH